MTDRLVSRSFTNRAYGFPRGAKRRVKPVLLAVAHITGNSRTSAYADQDKAVLAEWTYANRVDSPGPSASLYIGRHGRGLRAIDWRSFAQWSNGDVKTPDTGNAGIRRALALRARGYNLNEACGVEAELLGYGSSLPVTDAALDAFAEEIARAARYWLAHFEALLGVKGVEVIRSTTVVGHFQINSIDRRCCPGCDGPAIIAELVTRARAWYRKLYVPTPTPPTPTPPEVYPPMIATTKEPRIVVVRQGATLLDLNGKPLVEVANLAERDSPGGTAAGRLVWTFFSGATHLALARTADVVSSKPVPTDDSAARAALTAVTGNLALASSASADVTTALAAGSSKLASARAELVKAKAAIDAVT